MANFQFFWANNLEKILLPSDLKHTLNVFRSILMVNIDNILIGSGRGAHGFPRVGQLQDLCRRYFVASKLNQNTGLVINLALYICKKLMKTEKIERK